MAAEESEYERELEERRKEALYWNKEAHDKEQEFVVLCDTLSSSARHQVRSEILQEILDDLKEAERLFGDARAQAESSRTRYREHLLRGEHLWVLERPWDIFSATSATPATSATSADSQDEDPYTPSVLDWLIDQARVRERDHGRAGEGQGGGVNLGG